MKSKLIFYLFVFSVLILIFQIVNSNRVMEDQQSRLIEKEEKIQRLQQRYKKLQSSYEQQVYFRFRDTPALQKQFGTENTDSLQAWIENKIFSLNKSPNKLKDIFLEKEGKYFIEKIKLLNDRWLIALYSNGTVKKESLLSFAIDQNNALILRPLAQ